jgi:four helix bundle protein
MTESYRDLIAWQKGKALALQVYVCTRKFPNDEIYGLTSQMRCAAISVPSNIAEGKGRYSPKELLQFLYRARGSFLYRARGSLLELVTQMEIARDLDYLDLPSFKHLRGMTDELGRILNGLINRFQIQIERAS